MDSFDSDFQSERRQDSRGQFFAVDRRSWQFVCNLGMNAAIVYLLCARGSGGDNRTTKWSVNAVEARTGISRSRAQGAIRELIAKRALRLDGESSPSRPKYKITPAHELPGCDGYPPPALEGEQARVHQALGTDWRRVPKSAGYDAGYREWGTYSPRRTAEEMVKTGHVEALNDGWFRAIHYDIEAAARPNWTWLPNALVDGVVQEVPPIELIRQTGDVLTLRLLVNLYGAHALDEDGGIHFRQLRQTYTRHKVGEHGSFVVWGFVRSTGTAWQNAPFIAPHMVGVGDENDRKSRWQTFWTCLDRLRELGLFEYVAHLIHADTAEGEIIHPVALPGTGQEIEQQLGYMSSAVGSSLVTDGQRQWAEQQGVVMLAPVQRHIEGVQMVGIARLRYRPRTNRTLAFLARDADWQLALERLVMSGRPLATSR